MNKVRIQGGQNVPEELTVDFPRNCEPLLRHVHVKVWHKSGQRQDSGDGDFLPLVDVKSPDLRVLEHPDFLREDTLEILERAPFERWNVVLLQKR